MSARVVLLLSVCIGAAWGFLGYHVWQMSHLPMAEMWMPPSILVAWPLSDWLWVFVMWGVMMAAMMLPSIVPMLIAFSRYSQRDGTAGQWHTLWFASAYLAVWLGFSVALTGLQWLFHGLAWLSPMMENRQPVVAAAIFLIAGLYQFTPIKNACLQHCRTPIGFLLHAWRPGKAGAWRMGLLHGVNCLGCCWAQMLLMFAVGVMSLTGMILITLLVFAEKWAPFDARTFSTISGVMFCALAGLWLLVKH